MFISIIIYNLNYLHEIYLLFFFIIIIYIFKYMSTEVIFIVVNFKVQIERNRISFKACHNNNRKIPIHIIK